LTGTYAVMLEGSNGHAFFLKETLLSKGIVDRVDLVSRAEQVIDRLYHNNPYNLIVINLAEAWEQSTQLGCWLTRQPTIPATICIVPPDLEQPSFPLDSFVVLSTPLSLQHFATQARLAAQTGAVGNALMPRVNPFDLIT